MCPILLKEKGILEIFYTNYRHLGVGRGAHLFLSWLDIRIIVKIPCKNIISRQPKQMRMENNDCVTNKKKVCQNLFSKGQPEC